MAIGTMIVNGRITINTIQDEVEDKNVLLLPVVEYTRRHGVRLPVVVML